MSEDQNRRNASQSENKCRDERGEMENKKQKKQKNKWRDEKGEISEMNNRAAVA